MWLITTDGFISLVQDRHNHNMLQVRARVRADIERHFPSAYIYAVDGADYRYRARISKEKVALVMADKILNDLTYDSHFKDVAIAKDRENAERRSAYYGVWTALAKLQDWAPYASRSRKDQAAWNRANPLPKTAPYTSGRHYPGMAPIPTFEEARSIPGSPWREAGKATTSKIDREEAAREPEIWDVDTPDDPSSDYYPGVVLDAVEEAFGVNADVLPDEQLDEFVDMLRAMHLLPDAAFTEETGAKEDEELLDRIAEAREAGLLEVSLPFLRDEAPLMAGVGGGVAPMKNGFKKKKKKIPYVNNSGKRHPAKRR